MLFSKFLNTPAFEKLIHFLIENEALIDLKPFLLKSRHRFSVSEARLIGSAVYGNSSKKFRCIKLAEMIKSNVNYIAFEMAFYRKGQLMNYPGFLKTHTIQLLAEFIADRAEIRTIFLRRHRLNKQQLKELCQEIFNFEVSNKTICRIKSVIQKNTKQLLTAIANQYKKLLKWVAYEKERLDDIDNADDEDTIDSSSSISIDSDTEIFTSTRNED